MKTNDQDPACFVRSARDAHAEAAALWERIFVAKEWTDPDGWSLPGRAEACHLYDAHQQAEAQALASLAAWMRDGSEGPHPGGWTVSCHRGSDGNVLTLWRFGRKVATLGSCPLPVMIDLDAAEAEYQADKAWRRERQAAYDATRREVMAILQPWMVEEILLPVTPAPWRCADLAYSPGREGGTFQLVRDGELQLPVIGAGRILRRMAAGIAWDDHAAAAEAARAVWNAGAAELPQSVAWDPATETPEQYAIRTQAAHDAWAKLQAQAAKAWAARLGR